MANTNPSGQNGRGSGGSEEAAFSGEIPAGAVFLFIGAVFFTFAPLGLLLISDLSPTRGLAGILVILLLGGLAAVSWVATFSVSWKFVGLILLFSSGFFIVHIDPVAGWLGLGGQEGAGGLTVIGVVLSLSIIAGYILFLLLILTQGRRMVAMGEEMRLAREIHDTLVPAVSKTIGRVQAHGISLPSAAMGGDLIDVIEHPGGVDCVLADVSGHGVKAGIVMGMVKSSLRTSLLGGEPLPKVVGDLNRVLCDTLRSGMFVTLSLVRVLPGGERAEVVLAGHHPLVRVSRMGLHDEVPNTHIPLGVLDAEQFTPETIDLRPGDVLVMYTDGLCESMNEHRQLLGHEPLIQRASALRDRPLGEIADGLIQAGERFGETDDDRSVLLMRVLGAE